MGRGERWGVVLEDLELGVGVGLCLGDQFGMLLN